MSKTATSATFSISFNQLIDELKEKYPFIIQVYYSEHWGSWEIIYHESVPRDKQETEWETFAEVLACLERLAPLLKTGPPPDGNAPAPTGKP